MPDKMDGFVTELADGSWEAAANGIVLGVYTSEMAARRRAWGVAAEGWPSRPVWLVAKDGEAVEIEVPF